MPLYHFQWFGAPAKRIVAWVDGSWDMDRGCGAVGAMLLSSEPAAFCVSATIPNHLAAELCSLNKRQRNTQAELLAVLVLLLSCPEELRDAELLLYEDNTAAMHNILSGAAGDSQSRNIVAAIWLVAAMLRLRLWVVWVPTDLNPADCFSRPEKWDKRDEAAHLRRQ